MTDSEKRVGKIPWRDIWLMVLLPVASVTIVAVPSYGAVYALEAHLLSKATNYGELTSPSLNFFSVPYSNQTHKVSSFSVGTPTDCMSSSYMISVDFRCELIWLCQCTEYDIETQALLCAGGGRSLGGCISLS
jgi:hypothetical protein